MKRPTTLSIDEDVKKSFKKECVENNVDMSETTEQLWKDYVELSQGLKAERAKANGQG